VSQKSTPGISHDKTQFPYEKLGISQFCDSCAIITDSIELVSCYDIQQKNNNLQENICRYIFA
jgi:hypothetical protein